MAVPPFDTVWINGSVGAGKTETADRLGDELERRGIPGARVLDDAEFGDELVIDTTTRTPTEVVQLIAGRTLGPA